jgi:hypothetical protein
LPGRKFAATVLAIDPLIDANGRSVGVRACIDNRRLQLRPGMFARVNAVFGQRDNARVIPEEAIVPQGGKQFVIKVVNGSTPNSRVTQRTEVKIGLRSPGKVEVLEGLEPGETVVTAGQQRLQRDGTEVRVIDLAPPAPAQPPAASAAGAPAPDEPLERPDFWPENCWKKDSNEPDLEGIAKSWSDLRKQISQGKHKAPADGKYDLKAFGEEAETNPIASIY